MLSAILIDHNPGFITGFTDQLALYCPHLLIKGTASSLPEAQPLIQEETPDLMFVEYSSDKKRTLPYGNWTSTGVPTIALTQRDKCALEAIRMGMTSFLRKPVIPEDLIAAVGVAYKMVLATKEYIQGTQLIHETPHTPSSQLIGIPTMKGYDYLKVDEIIRCEGLQKCTRVVTRARSNIVSSYNLGEFRKALEPYGFFLAHKSHLVNLTFVTQYLREGMIRLGDDSLVPLARRKRNAFLQRMRHI